MNRKERRKAKVKCSRCGERVSVIAAVGWNATVKQGRVIGHLCPSCQTPEENAEAEINLATTTYGVDAFGRHVGFPKVEEPEPVLVCCDRCGTSTTSDLAPEWVLGLDDGQIVATVCPGCLTESEHLAVEVNDAMTELARVTPEEGFVVKPKAGEEP
ncbi:hypothetical protein [Leucobacter muris]|uniref:hypothetical protein n=1 Tax=Leucobacter muris TaxID=1935379 RepID=UPI00188681F6|nr:hypothetical protein [Leucobacter muris]